MKSNLLTIGGRQIKGPLALAPMAGTSDITFRTLCHEQGADLVCTELISARGIRYQQSITKSYRYLEIDPTQEGPVAIQLFGSAPEDFAIAIPLILEHPLLRQATCIDLNMGCPVPKVVKTGAGAALMKDFQRASAIIETSVRQGEKAGIPVTVKFRTGWDEAQINCVPFALMCRDAGAAAVTVHGRTREQMYQGQADWQSIAQVAEVLKGSKVVVFGNGDIRDTASAKKMLVETQVQGLMIGRAAQGNPWLFAQISAGLSGQPEPNLPSAEERVQIVLRHLKGLCTRLGETAAVKEMRGNLACYFKGQYLATQFKQRAMLAASLAEVETLLGEWLDEVS